jgi:hypothetical protein
MARLNFTPRTTSKERAQQWQARQRETKRQRDIAKLTALQQTNPTDCAYAAGIIDGEGTIGIHRRRERSTYRSLMKVGMCDPEAVQFLHALFGGYHIPARITHKSCPQHRPQEEWGAAAKEAANICRVILPFLKIKRRQALNLIELQDLHAKIQEDTRSQRAARFHGRYGRPDKGAYGINPKLLNRCHELWQDQKRLNQRGNSHDITATSAKAAASKAQDGRLDNSLSAELAAPVTSEDTESGTTLGSWLMGSR